jgi:hypothetical protein
MYLASFQTSLEAPWRFMKPLRVGRVPSGDPEPNRWVTVECHGNPVARIDVYAEHDGPFTELIVWGRFVVLGLGRAVHLIDPHSQQTWSLECDGYFGHLHPLGDRLLIASASALICVDTQARVVWRREYLGIDGVVVQGVEGGIVAGKGEWDPPGGWRSFRLLLATGVPTKE